MLQMYQVSLTYNQCKIGWAVKLGGPNKIFTGLTQSCKVVLQRLEKVVQFVGLVLLHVFLFYHVIITCVKFYIFLEFLYIIASSNEVCLV